MKKQSILSLVALVAISRYCTSCNKYEAKKVSTEQPKR